MDFLKFVERYFFFKKEIMMDGRCGKGVLLSVFGISSVLVLVAFEVGGWGRAGC